MSDTRTQVRLRPVIRVFVSSTFSDMKHERNALQEHVFPRLEELCQRQGFQFQAIDLRWGVSGEAGLDHRTMRICFDELRRAQEISPQPNFLILLGDRYGWRPLPEEISEDELRILEQAIPELPENERALAKATLETWYRCDANSIRPVYILRSRLSSPTDDKSYGEVIDDTGREQDLLHWPAVQEVLWSIINRAFPARDFNERFKNPLVTFLNEVASDPTTPLPSIVRFQASATEQEIWAGALSAPDAEEHVLAFIRDINNRGEFSDPSTIEDFFDVTPSKKKVDRDAEMAQKELKEVIKIRLMDNAIELPTAHLIPTKKPGDPVTFSTSHIDQLCHEVELRLTPIIERQISEYWEPQASGKTSGAQSVDSRTARELEIEIAEHLRFGKERGSKETFVGRNEEGGPLDRIRDYLNDSRLPLVDSRLPLVIHGDSGCGKTALLARAFQEIPGEQKPIIRFIGVTPRSSDARSLLSSLCQDLRKRHQLQGEIPADYSALRQELHEHLLAATPERPIILFLDALDQLSDADAGRLLAWIPFGPLPNHVKLVVSCLSEREAEDPACQPFVELKRRSIPEGNFIPLDELAEAEAKSLLFDRWLPLAVRTVSEGQRELIEQRIASAACRRPLYLKLLFEEARVWRSYDAPPALGAGVSSLLDQLFERLSRPENHTSLLVERTLGYLTAARRGLTENEILEVLYADPEYKAALDDANLRNRNQLPANARRIPIAIWSRLRFDIAPYLSERAAPGGSMLTFYHRQVAEWVRKHFEKANGQNWQPHRRLVTYFHRRADPIDDGSWRDGNTRGLTELPYHLAHSERLEELARLLTDLRYVDARCERSVPQSLLEDYELLLPQYEGAAYHAAREMHAFVRGHLQALTTYPSSFFSLAYYEGPTAARAAAQEIVDRGLWRKPWLRVTPRQPPRVLSEHSLGLGISVMCQYKFAASCAVEMARTRRLIFRVKSLGQIAIIDLDRLEELSHTLCVRPLRPVGLFVNEDSHLLAIAFENGEADILRLIGTSDGTPANTTLLATVRYLLPELDSPVMLWQGQQLSYQRNAETLVVWQAEDGGLTERIIDLPMQASGELAGAVALRDRLVLIVRQGTRADVVSRSAGGTSHTISRRGVIATCICAIGDNHVAVAWSDRKISVYELAPQLVERRSLSVEEDVRRICWDGERLVWMSVYAHLYVWSVFSAQETVRLQHDESLFPTGIQAIVFRLEAQADERFVVLTNAQAAEFRLTRGSSEEFQLRDLFESISGQVLAVHERGDGLWLFEESSGYQTHLADAKESACRPQCGTDGKRVLLAANGFPSRSVMLELAPRRLWPCRQVPQSIASIAGDVHGGFWINDRADRIYRVETDGRCRVAAKIPLDEASTGQLLCLGERLFWFGFCSACSDAGTEHVRAFVLYRCRDGELELLGCRTFFHQEGGVLAWDYDPASERLAIVGYDLVNGQHILRYDSPDSIVRGTEEMRVVPAMASYVRRVRLCRAGTFLIMLCDNGSLGWLELKSCRQLVFLQASIPFTGLVQGGVPDRSILLIQGGTRLLCCDFEVSS